MDNVAGFFVYNPTLGHEFSEGEKILAFYPDIDFNYQKQYVGLSEGLIGFASSFTQVTMLDYIQTSRYHFCVYSPEKNYFIVILTNKDENDDENDTTIKEILELSLKRFYNIFKLSNGTFHSVAKRQSYNGLRDRLSLLLSYYLPMIPLTPSIIPLNQGLQYLPIEKTTFLTLKYFITSLSTNFPFSRIVSIFYHDYLVYTSIPSDETLSLLLFIRYPILYHYLRENGLMQSRNDIKTDTFGKIHHIIDSYLPQQSHDGTTSQPSILKKKAMSHHDKEHEKTRCICIPPIPSQLISYCVETFSSSSSQSYHNADIFEQEHIPETRTSIPAGTNNHTSEHNNNGNSDGNSDGDDGDDEEFFPDDPPLLGVNRNCMVEKRNQIFRFERPSGYLTSSYPTNDLIDQYQRQRRRRLSSIFSEYGDCIVDSPIYDDEEDDDDDDEDDEEYHVNHPTEGASQQQDQQHDQSQHSTSPFWTPPIYFTSQTDHLHVNIPSSHDDVQTNPYRPDPRYASQQPTSALELEQRQLLHHKYILKRIVAALHGVTLPEDLYDEHLMDKQKKIKAEKKKQQQQQEEDEKKHAHRNLSSLSSETQFDTFWKEIDAILEHDYTVETEHYREYLQQQEYLMTYHHQHAAIFIATQLTQSERSDALEAYQQRLKARQMTLRQVLQTAATSMHSTPTTFTSGTPATPATPTPTTKTPTTPASAPNQRQQQICKFRTKALSALSNYLDEPGVFTLVPTPDSPLDEVDVLFDRILDDYVEEKTVEMEQQKEQQQQQQQHHSGTTSETAADGHDAHHCEDDDDDHDDMIRQMYEPSNKEMNRLRKQLYYEIRAMHQHQHQQQVYNPVLSTSHIKSSLYTSIFHFLSVNMAKITNLFTISPSSSPTSPNTNDDASRYPSSPGGNPPISPISTTTSTSLLNGAGVLPYLYYNATNHAVVSTLHPSFLNNTLYSSFDMKTEASIQQHVAHQLDGSPFQGILSSSSDLMRIINQHYMIQNGSLSAHSNSITFDGNVNRTFTSQRYNRQFYDDVVIHYPVTPSASRRDDPFRLDRGPSQTIPIYSYTSPNLSNSILHQYNDSNQYYHDYYEYKDKGSPRPPPTPILSSSSSITATTPNETTHINQKSIPIQATPSSPSTSPHQHQSNHQIDSLEPSTSNLTVDSELHLVGSRRRTAIDMGTAYSIANQQGRGKQQGQDGNLIPSPPSMLSSQQMYHSDLSTSTPSLSSLSIPQMIQEDINLSQLLLTSSSTSSSTFHNQQQGITSPQPQHPPQSSSQSSSAGVSSISSPSTSSQQHQEKTMSNLSSHFTSPVQNVIQPSISELNAPPSSSLSLNQYTPQSAPTIPIYDWSLLTVDNVDTIHSSIAIKGLLLSYMYAKREYVLSSLDAHQKSQREKITALLSPRNSSGINSGVGDGDGLHSSPSFTDEPTELVNTNDLDISQFYTQDELSVDFSWLLSSNSPVSLFSVLSTPTTVITMANAIHTQRQIIIVVPNVFHQVFNCNNFTLSPTQMTQSSTQCVRIPLSVVTQHHHQQQQQQGGGSAGIARRSIGGELYDPTTTGSNDPQPSSSFLTSLLLSASPLLVNHLSSISVDDPTPAIHSHEPFVTTTMTSMTPSASMLNTQVTPTTVLLPNIIDISTIVNAMQKSTFQRIFSF